MTDPKSNSRRRVGVIAMVASVAAIAAGALAYAHSGGGHHGHARGKSAETHLEHVKGMLSKVGATDAQQAQIEGILKPALADMEAARTAHSAVFKQFHEAMTAPSIDRARLESLRAEQLRSMDETSKRLITAVIDAAEVLTAEQRAELARHIENHHRG